MKKTFIEEIRAIKEAAYLERHKQRLAGAVKTGVFQTLLCQTL